MRSMSLSKSGIVCLLIGVLLCSAATIQAAQKVPITFDRYHGYTGTVKYLQDVARAYPSITRLLDLGKSTMGRTIHMLVITNMKTGTTIDAHVPLRNMRKEGVKNVPPMQSYQGKPGHLITGATHGNEFTGTEVCLYTIDKLVSSYGSDEEITRLVDQKTFYILPIVNPDGVYNSVEKGLSQRQNSMQRDDDGDGRINEDGWDDLNKDGKITYFRYKNSSGRYVIDEQDPRVMIALQRGAKTDKPRYNMVVEDVDNDGDGKRGEDPEGGIDLNRNFGEGWFRDDGFAGGTGDYPFSAPETRSIAEFLTNHTNVLLAQNYHTSGGFTFRPMGTAPHSRLHPKDVAVLDFIMGKKYLEIIGEEVPEAWQKPQDLSKFKEELKKASANKYAQQRGYVLPRGWRVSYNENEDRRYSYGMATDWMYAQYGIFAITTELWNPAQDIPGLPKVEGEDARTQIQREIMKYQDEKYGGRLFTPWTKFTHPQLGEGEIGGMLPVYRNNAFPGEPLLKVCEDHWQFTKFRAGLLPEVEIKDAKAEVLYTTNSAKDAKAVQRGWDVTIQKGSSKGRLKVIKVTATISNTGKLATHVARGSQLAGNREDVVWLVGDRDKVTFLQGTPYQQLGVLEGTQSIPGYQTGRADPAAAPSAQQRRMRMMYPPGYPMPMRFGQRASITRASGRGASRTATWIVAVEGNTPLKVVVTSQKGGTKVKELRIQ
jgi:hypothetical protein